jgi:hypothetical protein
MKSVKTSKSREKLKTQAQTQKLLLKHTPPNTLNANSPPLDRHYHVSSLNHPVSNSSTNFVHNLFPFDNEFIKHNPRKA